jgi:MFS family permease
MDDSAAEATGAQSVGVASTRRISQLKAITAITVGNGLEFFDFTIYSFFATIIGKLYFPVEGQLEQLMLALGTFGVGFIMRPIGGAVLGGYADRAGRKAAMNLTLWLMTLGSAIIAFAPTYATIGLVAPALIILARLIQGFAIGGEGGRLADGRYWPQKWRR